MWPRPEPDPPRPTSRDGAPGAGQGLGRLLLELDKPSERNPAETDAVRSPAEWRARAAEALGRGDLWFSCTVALDGPGRRSRSRGTTAGAVLTAVESAGWRLERIDHVWVPGPRSTPVGAAGGSVMACYLLRPVSFEVEQVWPDVDFGTRPRHGPAPRSAEHDDTSTDDR